MPSTYKVSERMGVITSAEGQEQEEFWRRRQ